MIRTLAVLLITAVTAGAAEKLVVEKVALSPEHQLVFEHPENLRYEVVQDPDDGFRTALSFRGFGADGVSTLSFKIFAGKDDEDALKTQADVDAAVKEISEGYVDGSLEKASTVRRITQKGGFGAYCIFTDAELAGVARLPPGQFRHITLGLVKVGNYVFTVRGYSNDEDGDDYKAMLNVLGGLRIEQNAAGGKAKKDE